MVLPCHIYTLEKEYLQIQERQMEVMEHIYDIKMENDLPEYLQYDFGLTKE